MKLKTLLFSLFATSMLFAYEQMPQNASHGNFLDKDKWKNLDKNWVYCESGLNQNFININTKKIINKNHSFEFNYTNDSFGLINDGYTIKMHFASNGSHIVLDNTAYNLSHFHFHAPSKISIDKKSYPLEIHFSHVSQKGDIAVVTLFLQEGKENPFIKKIIRAFPKKEGDKLYVQGLNANELLPNNTQSFYIFKNKLNKPCDQKITWIVLKDISYASKEQIQTIQNLMGKNENLKIQEINNLEQND
ncbi:carbonic anhydrase [Campylobacter lari]|uniref:carbonic anhydrase n=1 Tax=Campylobacter lari NCTC 11845 TaxID=1388749 RepID=A0A0A8HYH3_CAMLA|nr:carbonic anhydrase alpha [Campylobacter lari]AJD02541.1 carbonic anhydrase alpha [Campylobacter lari NCTC 11845]EAK9955017.1 carbonic anhydrase alpha [Campylobacter lari]MCR6543628.1 carbonic anhydrase alpha [Campylobacter lari]STA75947.1 carbonic anhydrase [Campylobacter lari]